MVTNLCHKTKVYKGYQIKSFDVSDTISISSTVNEGLTVAHHHACGMEVKLEL